MANETIISMTKDDLTKLVYNIAEKVAEKYATLDHIHTDLSGLFDVDNGVLSLIGFGSSGGGDADSAIYDSSGQQIDATYIKDLSIDGNVITFTRGDNSTDTITTQDLNTARASSTADVGSASEWTPGSSTSTSVSNGILTIIDGMVPSLTVTPVSVVTGVST